MARVALVVGGAESVFEEVEAARALLGRPFDLIIACNDVGAKIPDITHWVSLHHDKLPHWISTRVKNKLPGTGFEIWCHRNHRKFKCRVTSDWGGSSGLFAVRVALLELGATHVICAGVPMTTSPHYHRKAAWRFADHHIKGWRNHHREINGRVKSMSGRTREMLGAPTAEWLATNLKPAPKEEKKMPTYLCPRCGAAEITREKRPNGNARCAKGHSYRAREARIKPEPVVVEAADVGEVPAEILAGILAEPSKTSVPAVAQTVEGSATEHHDIAGKSVIFEALVEFQYKRGEHVVAHYAPGLRYTCRTRAHAELIDEWVAAGKVRLMDAVRTGTSHAEVSGVGVVT